MSITSQQNILQTMKVLMRLAYVFVCIGSSVQANLNQQSGRVYNL